ncbi:hypothetical protein [Micromonospora aurantiaca (nom. illeg.)]|uniref:hypothetical protein n=1 Tax=Micromonospora aurantiaca (nom. illeg.) TaxID=47850 RepID=UPI0033CF581C
MIRNVHERHLPVPASAAGALIDSLAGPEDRLWPLRRWPAMRLDRPLGVGATGGHGPVRYTVQDYRPGAYVRFRFLAPAGFRGHHEFEVLPGTGDGCLLRHRLVMTAHGSARVSWPLFFRPLHDALVEDSLDTAVVSLGLTRPAPRRWPARVRVLRGLARTVSRGRRTVR